MTIGEAAAAARSARQVLFEAQSRAGPDLRAAVDRLPDGVRQVVAHHAGLAEAPGTGQGKAMRPALALMGASAVGADLAVGVPAAVAVELVHDFSLLHDDVMDRDIVRRGRPAAWAVFGEGMAVLAGDALLALAFDVLKATGHAEATRVLAVALLELMNGQAADLAFEERAYVGVAECVAMAEGKTAALLGCACALGALLGGGDPAQVQALSRFGRSRGWRFSTSMTSSASGATRP